VVSNSPPVAGGLRPGLRRLNTGWKKEKATMTSERISFHIVAALKRANERRLFGLSKKGGIAQELLTTLPFLITPNKL
jgi:hypothetical protein